MKSSKRLLRQRQLILAGTFIWTTAAPSVFSAPLPSCHDLLAKKPAALKASEDVTVLPEEVSMTGKRWSAGDSLQALPPGKYLYVLLQDGTLWINSRLADGATAEKYLATHRALVAEARASGDAAEIVAAGEFETVIGWVPWLSNRSGTYRGGAASLAESRRTLESRGLRFDDRTLMRDFEANPELVLSWHIDASKEARMLLKFKGTPVLEKIENLYVELAKRFPPSSPNPDGCAFALEQPMENANSFVDQVLDDPNPTQEAENLASFVTELPYDLSRQGIPRVLSLLNDRPELIPLFLEDKIQRILLGH